MRLARENRIKPLLWSCNQKGQLEAHQLKSKRGSLATFNFSINELLLVSS